MIITLKKSSLDISTRLLAILIICMLGGIFQIISQFSRFGLWGIWAIIWWLLWIEGRKLSLQQMLWNGRFFLAWMILYLTWGVIVSPIPVFWYAFRNAFYTITVFTAVCVLAKDRKTWLFFADLAPWMIVLNLTVSLMLLYYPPFQDYMTAKEIAHTNIQIGTDRYSGLWGNANAGGLNTLVLLILSIWSQRRHLVLMTLPAAFGFIYLTASRTTFYLLIVILILFLYDKFRHSRVIRIVLFTAVIGVLGLLIISESSFIDMFSEMQTDSVIARWLDPAESSTIGYRGHTRLNVMRKWIPYIEREPWSGYGYSAMAGGGSLGIIRRTDIPYSGVHNLYLGLWLDVGLWGLLSFIALLSFGFVKFCQSKLLIQDRPKMIAFWVIVIVFALTNHNMLFDMGSLFLYACCFLLYDLPGVKKNQKETIPYLRYSITTKNAVRAR